MVMHCNLRPPDVARVVLGFNYESHNAPACQIAIQSSSKYFSLVSAETLQSPDGSQGCVDPAVPNLFFFLDGKVVLDFRYVAPFQKQGG